MGSSSSVICNKHSLTHSAARSGTDAVASAGEMEFPRLQGARGKRGAEKEGEEEVRERVGEKERERERER